MNTLTKTHMKRLLMAATLVLAPTAVLAAQHAPAGGHAAYRNAFNAGGPVTSQAVASQGVMGPAGPTMATSASACRNDPHALVQQALWGDGPGYECHVSMPAASGAHGPAGPIMGHGDAFQVYQRSFTAD